MDDVGVAAPQEVVPEIGQRQVSAAVLEADSVELVGPDRGRRGDGKAGCGKGEGKGEEGEDEHRADEGRLGGKCLIKSCSNPCLRRAEKHKSNFVYRSPRAV